MVGTGVQGRVVCVGGAAIDRTYRAPGDVRIGTSNPMQGRQGFGGVARNVAETLARLRVPVALASLVGDDANGRAIRDHCGAVGIDATTMLSVPDARTAEYVAVLDGAGDLVLGIADMDIFDAFDAARLERVVPHLAGADWIFADCNLPAQTLRDLVHRRREGGFRLAIDTVSMPKAVRLPRDLNGVALLVLNLDEAAACLGLRDPTPEVAVEGLRAAGAASVVLTRGSAGVLVATADGISQVAAAPATPVDVTGAGDALIAGTLFRILAGDGLVDAVRVGTVLAAMATEARGSVHPDLTPQRLEDRVRRAAATKQAEAGR